jgi:hypothetical protein
MQQFLKRLKYYAAMLLFLVSSTAGMTAPVFAYSSTNPNDEYHKVYICKYVGTPGVDERLQTGDNPISTDTNSLKDFTGLGSFFNDKQGRSIAIAWDNGDHQEPSITMCPPAQGPTQVSIPAPNPNDPCGVGNASWTKPADTDQLTWSLTAGVLSVQTKTGFVFTDGTTSHNYGVAVDSNVLCPPTEVAIPVAPVPNDPCGPNNAYWVKPADTSDVTWSVVNGELIAHTTAGKVFTDGSVTHNYGVAVDSDVACPNNKVDLPPVPTFKDDCGLSNAIWNVPADTATVTWSLHANGELYASTTSGNEFKDGTTSHNYGIAPDSNVLCPVAPVTFDDQCGTANDSYIVPTTFLVDYKVGANVVTAGSHPGAGTITVNAYPQSNQVTLSGTTTWTHTFTSVPCDSSKVLVCHATDSRKNPYVLIDVAAAGAYDGHLGHTGPVYSPLLQKHTKWGDIIPEFNYNGQTYSFNWDLAGQAAYAKYCVAPQPIKVHTGHVEFEDISCDENGSFMIPATPHVTYKDAQGNVLTAGTHTVTTPQTVTIRAYADQGYSLKGRTVWTFVFTQPEDCGGGNGGGTTTPVTPGVVTFKDATCDAAGTYTVPSTTGVIYKDASGKEVKAGIYSAVPGQVVTINAFAEAGYKLNGSATWTHTFLAATNCGQVLGETTSTPSTPAAPAGGQGAGVSSGEVLSDTGTSAILPTLLAATMMLTAFGTVLYRKRNAE